MGLSVIGAGYGRTGTMSVKIGAIYWRELAEFYPEAKIILTMRPAEGWWKSYAGTIMAFLEDIPTGAPPHVVDVCNMMIDRLGNKTFGSAFNDEQGAIAAYNNHVEEVSSSFSDDRLLCLDVKDGWEPLCNFLGKPVPDTEFPRANTADEFWENFGPGD